MLLMLPWRHTSRRNDCVREANDGGQREAAKKAATVEICSEDSGVLLVRLPTGCAVAGVVETAPRDHTFKKCNPEWSCNGYSLLDPSGARSALRLSASHD